jgi:hypothetical protein
MDENVKNLERAVVATMPADVILSEAELAQRVEQFRAIFWITDDERDQLLKRLHARLAIRMDTGVALTEHDHKPWLLARKPQIDPFYWDRFSTHLSRLGWPGAVITAVDRVTDELLDLCGDPTRTHPWKRRGLVVGDVQSGKTSNYTALCCKASDAGYRLIILLTGTLESLRRQTQERLDTGFIGLDSSGFLSTIRQNRSVGVGLIDQRRSGVVFTSRIKDFSTAIVNQLNFRLDAFHEPILLVVKKNKKILQNLHNWLKDYNVGTDGYVDVPVMLIDDEADNASINTRGPDEDPAAINSQIRTLLALFHRSSYVGFTATPFANIFIDPESEAEMLGNDLFPRDYIYALDAPTNYVGATRVFGDGSTRLLRSIEDAETVFPHKHKISLVVSELPGTLIEAIDAFVLANAVRDLRGEGATHRSMLINVSRFTDVQTQVAQIVEQHVREMQGDVRNYSRLAEDEALQNPTIKRLKETWDEEFADLEFRWPEIQQALKDAILPIAIRAVNQRTGAASLDYAVHRENGLRAIAVGGNSLSRGLTLEGLCTSYFYRNSQMYDTLLQMGRWFGYRDGYEDVCRIWLSPEAQHWYGHITEATEELRAEIRRMHSLGLTPREFGLKVRAHPDSLIVTARNKMRAAKTVERVISVSEQGLETPHLFGDKTTLATNAEMVREFLKRIESEGARRRGSLIGTANPIWLSVSKGAVAQLLRRFKAHPRNVTFRGEDLAEFLEATNEPKLGSWDVVVPSGTGEPWSLLPSLVTKLQKRVVTVSPSGEVLVSGKSARVGSRGVEREGMDAALVRQAEDEYRAGKDARQSIPDRVYRAKRERPLLLIHCIEAHKRVEGQKEPVPVPAAAEQFIALALSFPQFDDTQATKKVTYKVNVVEWRSLFEDEVEEEEDDSNLELA